ncbi:MAG: hypothetical protein ABSH51_29990 [Solirubrobacteraceae bacterium]
MTAVAVLASAATAYAALNTYQASLSFTTKSAGTAAKPVPVGFTQKIVATGTGGNRTAVLLDIKTKVYGLKVDSKDFPTCSLSSIATAQSDTACPKKALVATGAITASLGKSTDFSIAGTACDPELHVWNSGAGKLAFFFVDTPTHPCLGGALHTGQVGPYPATYKTSGKYLIVDVPIPAYVDFPLGTAGGLAGSLTGETLDWLKSTTTVKGKTVAAISSVACSGSERPYSTTFTATLPTTNATGPVATRPRRRGRNVGK